MIKRKKKREQNLPHFMADWQRPNKLTHRFFVEKHAENAKMLTDLHRIEAFVDTISKKRKRELLDPDQVKHAVKRELKTLGEMKHRFAQMMKKHPYDTFFDESVLSKPGLNLYEFMQEIDANIIILQKCLDTGTTRDAPTDLNKELFKFSQFIEPEQKIASTPGTPKSTHHHTQAAKISENMHSYKIEEKSVQEDEAFQLAQKENSRLKLYTRILESELKTPILAARKCKSRGARRNIQLVTEIQKQRMSQGEMVDMMMNRVRNKSRDLEQLGSIDFEYNDNTQQFNTSIKKMRESLNEVDVASSFVQ